MNIKTVRRKKRIKRLRKSFYKFKQDVKSVNPEANFKDFPLYKFIVKLNSRPSYSELIIQFISENGFCSTNDIFDNSVIEVPHTFSIIDDYSNTTLFLRKLINTLHYQSYEHIIIDYKNCNQIDVCASMCMDIILNEFIVYFESCGKGRHSVKIREITPINYSSYNVTKILFSIGAYRNLKGWRINFDNIIPFSILVGNKDNPKLDDKRELDITKTVDYLIESLATLNRKLTDEAETNFYKVIGEVIQNAEEHSSSKFRFLIGFFEKSLNDLQSFGVFNLAILNFGNSFYETFKNGENPNCLVIEQMEKLSSRYTASNFFRKKVFEEETLWTLYSLQDGVTRFKDWDRGNGTMRFIEKFLELKGEEQNDFSKMVLTTGHTRIIFDGSYDIVLAERNKTEFKMMTFNSSGNIEDIPDNNFVRYEENYFPGTMISVKLKLDSENTEKLN